MDTTIVIRIIAFIIIGYLIYYVVKHYFNKNNNNQITLLDQITYFDESYSNSIKRTDIFPPNVNYSISWKMKVSNIPSNFIWKSSFTKSKPIIQNGGSPNIYYNPSDNTLIIKFELLDTNSAPFYKDIVIKNIKLQKWNSYVLVAKGRNISFYINGLLEYSYLLPAVPLIQKGNLKFGEKENNFLGKIANVVYYNYPLEMNQIK